MNKQDWYLNQLGVTQYILRKPAAIKGEASIVITENIKLVIISDSTPNDKIFYDILKAIRVEIDDCLILAPSQLIMPITQFDCVIWFIDEHLPDTWQSAPDLKDKPIIYSVSLPQLATSAHLKRQLWNTLCQYENYFHPN